jgi:uncharacterized membrane protein
MCQETEGIEVVSMEREQSKFALVYSDKKSAKSAYKLISQLHRQKQINLKYAALGVRNRSGLIIAEETKKYLNPLDPKYRTAGLVGGLVGFIGTNPSGPGALVAGGFWDGVASSVAMGLDLRERHNMNKNLGQTLESLMAENNLAVIVHCEVIYAQEMIAELEKIGIATVVPYELNDVLYDQMVEGLEVPQPVEALPAQEALQEAVPIPIKIAR